MADLQTWEVVTVSAVSSFCTYLVQDAIVQHLRKAKPAKPVRCKRCIDWPVDTLEGPGQRDCNECKGTGLNLDNEEAVIGFIRSAREKEWGERLSSISKPNR